MDSPLHLKDAGSELVPHHPIKRQRTSNTSDLRKTHDNYTVAWICALPIELAAAQAVLDEIHDSLPQYLNDHNTYVLGSVEGHNVAIACLPSNQYGIVNAANVVTNLTRTFTAIRIGLMVGIGGGVPSKVDLRLGDIVVGTRVMQPDLGKIVENGELERTAIPRIPHQSLNTAVSLLRARHELDGSQVPSIVQQMLERRGFSRPRLPDRLFQADYKHSDPPNDCDMCDQTKLVARSTRTSKDPLIHYGAIASGSQVIKDGTSRDQVARQLNVICFEMEAAGLMDALPCLPIRGICDYCDSHKSKQWQKYAAATAAAYARELLGVIPITEPHTREMDIKTPDTDSQSSQEGRRQDLLDSLRFEQIDARKSSIKHAHAKTCQWILTHPEYKAWLDSRKLTEHHGFLWIRGKPGAGKSTIMKYIYLKMRDKTHPKNAIASFFFNARGESLEKTIVGMYRSLLLQLLECYADLQTVLDPPELLPAHKKNAIHSLDVLKELLNRAIMMLGQRPFTCFIDALDECDEQQVLDMIQFFEEVAENSTAQQIPLKICFSSRHYPYIIIRWGSRIVLEHQKGHTEDLEAYVDGALRAKEPEVIKKLLEKAAGVFMWVALVVQILNREYARGAMFIHQRLEELPGNLSDLFRNIIRRDTESMDELLLCFLWILCAERPLQPEEFYHALWSGLLPPSVTGVKVPDAAIQDAGDSLPRAHRYVISSSKGLAEVAESMPGKKIVQFIHESVRDFLIKDGGLYELWPELGLDWEGPTHERLKNCCSAYLDCAFEHGKNSRIQRHLTYEYGDKEYFNSLYFPECRGSRIYDIDPLPFLEYAGQNILYHANAASRTFPQDEFLSSFDILRWIGVYNFYEQYVVRSYTDKATLVYILADQGCPELIRTLLKREPEINIKGERYSYPLFAVLARGDKSSFAALLNLPSTIYKGVDLMEGFDSRKALANYKGRTPLSWAIEQKRNGIAALLIERGMDEGALYQHLWEAARYGNETIMGLLVQWIVKTAGPKSSDNATTPLDLNNGNTHEAIVKLLADREANLNLLYSLDSSKSSKPKYQAPKTGNTTIVKLLLGQEADVNLPDKKGQTPLHCAVEWGSDAVVKLLLDRGSDVNVSDSRGQTPLHCALEQSSTTVIQLLLDNGANINASDRCGKRPLHHVSERGREAIAKLLLDYGSDVNVFDGTGRMPLHYASGRGHDGITKLLLSYQSYVHVSDDAGQTPLHMASEQGNDAVVKLLLDSGSSINRHDHSGQTPLYYACARGHDSVSRLLLAHGSKVNAYDLMTRTPLHEASKNGSIDITKLLLDRGSLVNVPDISGRTPLHGAAELGYYVIVKLLLDYGSDANAIDNFGQTPIHMAIRNGWEDVAQALLDKAGNAQVIFGLSPHVHDFIASVTHMDGAVDISFVQKDPPLTRVMRLFHVSFRNE